MSLQASILSLQSDEFAARARRHLARGAGVSRTLYASALRTGRFEPETLGLSGEASRAWREHFRLELPKVVRTAEEVAETGEPTVKAVLAGTDGLEFEMVRVPMGRGRFTLCVSSQVGCKLACRFCETGRMGWLRDLTSAEIVGQVVVARSTLGWAVRNIVFMGMGEPLDNPDQVLKALRILNDPVGLSYGQARLTVCTVGHPAGLARLAELGWRRLDVSISLNSATDGTRDSLMPVNRRVGLAALRAALEAYPRRRGFVFGMNYCLLPGINDRPEDAQAVATFCEGLRVMVNVIPYNPGTRALTRAPTDDEVTVFMERLRGAGVPVTCRSPKGRSVMAACGQLGNLTLRARSGSATDPALFSCP